MWFHRRVMPVVVLILIWAGLCNRSDAQTTVFVVRHAEKAQGGDDPSLSPEGKKRAKDLLKVLRTVRLKAIYATHFKRTQETVAPTSTAFGLAPILRDDVAELAKMLKKNHPKQTVLVAGHSNTIPELLEALGAKDSVTIGETEFDNLFVVFLASDGSVLTQHLHYGK